MINHNYVMLFISHYLILRALASSTKPLSGSMRYSKKARSVPYPSYVILCSWDLSFTS